MKCINAIRVGDKIEKTSIDFSSYESLIESSGFKRIYRIHTAGTIAISNELGFRVGGFCDDYGSGGSFLAAKIAGYPSLPSDLILCLNDDQYNYLPLDEKQLDALYKYLISVHITEDTVEEVMEDDGGDKKASLNFDFSYEEPVLDGYILKIDSKFYYRDTYDETEKEGHDELEIANKNSIRLNSCFRYVHVDQFNKQRHDVDVFIGESDNPKNCRAYTVTLNHSAHYTYHFNGGVNDNFHVEDVDILVRMEKK